MVASLLYAFVAIHVPGQPLVVAVGGRYGQSLLFVIVFGGGGWGWWLAFIVCVGGGGLKKRGHITCCDSGITFVILHENHHVYVTSHEDQTQNIHLSHGIPPEIPWIL